MFTRAYSPMLVVTAMIAMLQQVRWLLWGARMGGGGGRGDGPCRPRTSACCSQVLSFFLNSF